MPASDLQWFARTDLHQYRGEYVIISDKHVFAHGLNLKEMVATFRKKYPGKVPAVAKITKEDVLVLCTKTLPEALVWGSKNRSSG